MYEKLTALTGPERVRAIEHNLDVAHFYLRSQRKQKPRPAGLVQEGWRKIIRTLDGIERSTLRGTNEIR